MIAAAFLSFTGWLLWRMRCRHVEAKRQPMGGFKCPKCGQTFDTLPTLGERHEGYVDLAAMRKAGM